MAAEIVIKRIMFEHEGKEYSATPATKAQIAAAGLNDGCNCGDEYCYSSWVYRCMAGGGGACQWYITDLPC